MHRTLNRNLLQKFPVYRSLTTRVHMNLDTRPLKTSLVTLPPFLTEPRRGPHRNLAWRNCLSTTGANGIRTTRPLATFFGEKPRQAHTSGFFHQASHQAKIYRICADQFASLPCCVTRLSEERRQPVDNINRETNSCQRLPLPLPLLL